DAVSAVHGGDVDAAAQAHGAVEQEAAQCVEEVVAAALRKAVHGRPEVSHVEEDVMDTGARRTWRDGFVAVGAGFEQDFVDGFVKAVYATVHAFPGVGGVGILYAGASGGQKHGSGGGSQA